MTCAQCAIAAGPKRLRTSAVNFECIACCLRWLAGMDAETMRLNAPVIGLISGPDFLEKVRKAWMEK